MNLTNPDHELFGIANAHLEARAPSKKHAVIVIAVDLETLRICIRFNGPPLPDEQVRAFWSEVLDQAAVMTRAATIERRT